MIYSMIFILCLFSLFVGDHALGAYYYNGADIIILYGFMNFYIWYLQYMYTPTFNDV